MPERNPFIAVAIAAATGNGLPLTVSQCRKLMKNDRFYETAVDAMSMAEFEATGCDPVRAIVRMKNFAKLDPAKPGIVK